MNTSDIKQPLPASNPKTEENIPAAIPAQRPPMPSGPVAQNMPLGPPVRGGIPFIVYDSRDFHDRSESTWAYCSQCNQIGMTVTKVLFSWRAQMACAGDDMKLHERVHYCPFCDVELGRRYNVKNCCSK